jgi:hypothetical protein
MVIKKEELMKIISIDTKIEKNSKISFDGRNLLTRVPIEVIQLMNVRKGHEIKWIINKNKELKIELVKKDV